MTETYTFSEAPGTWSVPQCPFTIEYSRQVLDDIRLAVMDAYTSLPGGGAEIDGVLLGKYENDRLTISQHLPLESEHAFGPSFTLSPKDQAALEELLAAARRNFNDLQPVGWYHSHTRSPICLSEADVDIHNRYFRESWQVALVVRPSETEPTRAGFFFRETDGKLNAEASYREVAVEALPVSLLPGGAGAKEATPRIAPELPANEPVVVTSLTPLPKIQPEPQATSAPPAIEAPANDAWAAELARSSPDSPLGSARSRRRIAIIAGIAAVLALGAATYQRRNQRAARALPTAARVAAKPAASKTRPPVHPVSQTVPASKAAPPVAQAAAPAHKPAVPAASASPAAPPAPAADSALRKEAAELGKQNAELVKANTELRKEKEDLTRQTAKYKSDLAAEAGRLKALQQQYEQLRTQQQRRRLANQANAAVQ